MPELIVLLVVVGAIALFVVGIYNGLIGRRNRIDEALAQIQVQLNRRHDLIPNLVNAVKGYMQFEQKVLTDVTNARAAAVTAGAQGVAAQAQAENMLTSTLRSLFAVVENYPELKANQNALELQEQLTTTENQIAFSRQHYNASVLDYNTAIQVFPAVVIAGMFGFTKRDFFDAEPAAMAVAVLFGGLAAAGSYFAGDSVVLSVSGAKEVDETSAPQLLNVVREMAIAANVPMPKVYVIDDTAPNAFATGRDPQHASVAITKGLLEKLDREELQGVIGHELSHVRNLDIRFALIVGVLVGSIALISDWFLRYTFWFGGGRRDRDSDRG